MADLDFDLDLDADLGELRAFVRSLREAQGELKGLDRASRRNLTGIDSSIAGAAGAGAFFGTVLAGVASKAVDLALALARVSAQAVFAFGKAAVEAALFGESIELGFKTLMRGSGDAGAQIQRVTKIATDLGLPVQDTLKQFQKLLAMQFAPKAAEDIVKMMADLKAVGADAEQVSRAVAAITQIKAKGRLQSEELVGQLAEAGVSTELVMEALGKQLGKTTKEVRKLLEAGKITADQGIAAIGEAVKKKTGIKEFGEAGKRFADNTLTGLVARLRAKGEALMLDIGRRILEPLRGAVKPVIDDIFAFMESEDGKGLVDGIVSGFTTLGAVVKAAWPVVKEFVGAFKEGFSAAMKPVEPLIAALKKMTGNETQMKNLAIAAQAAGTALGFLVAQGIGIAAFAGSVIAGISLVVGKIRELVTWVTTGGGTLGTGLISGFVSGITAGAARVVAAIKGVATSALASAKAALGIASPSKEFAFLGEMTSLGFAQGVDFGAPAANDNVGSLVAPPSAPAVGRAGGGGSSNTISVTVNISGGTGELSKADIEDAVRRGVEQALDQLSSEAA